jgi:hypothetical protein
MWPRIRCTFQQWYSRFEVTWLLRDDPNSNTRVLFVYMKNLKMLNESSPQLRTIQGYGSAATQIHDRTPFYLGVGISINSGGINLVLYDHAFSNNNKKKPNQKHPRQTNYYLSYQFRWTKYNSSTIRTTTKNRISGDDIRFIQDQHG